MFFTIADWKDRSFVRGVNDCAVFCLTMVYNMTGFREAFEHIKYTTDRECMKMLKTSGGMKKLVCSYFGDTITIGEMKRGDLVALPTAPEERAFPFALGICLGVDCVTFGTKGLTYNGLKEVTMGWSI